MATANDIISGALRKLGITASETPLTSSEIADGLVELNNLGASKNLFPPVSNASDTVRVPRALEGALMTVLAERLVVDYANLQLSPSLEKQIIQAWNDIWRVTNGDIKVKFPNTLPMGSGNYDGYYLWDSIFFNETSEINF